MPKEGKALIRTYWYYTIQYIQIVTNREKTKINMNRTISFVEAYFVVINNFNVVVNWNCDEEIAKCLF